MPNSLSQEQLRQLARHGAAARIEELESEIAAIRAAFPDLRGYRGRPGRPIGGVAKGEAPTRRTRRRRSMSAAARRAVSERMKKYWAARRAKKAGGKKQAA